MLYCTGHNLVYGNENCESNYYIVNKIKKKKTIGVLFEKPDNVACKLLLQDTFNVV